MRLNKWVDAMRICHLCQNLIPMKILVYIFPKISILTKRLQAPSCHPETKPFYPYLPGDPGGGGNLTCLWYGVVPFFRVPFS